MGSKVRHTRIVEADLRDQQKRFDQSGQTVIAFCDAEGIPVSTFYQRRARCKKSLADRSPVATKCAAKFIDAGTAQINASTSSATHALLGGMESSSRLEVRIDLGGGVVLHVSRN